MHFENSQPGWLERPYARFPCRAGERDGSDVIATFERSESCANLKHGCHATKDEAGRDLRGLRAAG